MQKTFWLDACNPNSIDKLQVDYTEEDDGSGTIHIAWDETDPDFQWWTDLGSERQTQFLIDALYAACHCYDN